MGIGALIVRAPAARDYALLLAATLSMIAAVVIITAWAGGACTAWRRSATDCSDSIPLFIPITL